MTARVASVAAAVAAASSLALGMAGAAAAQPGITPVYRYTVFNESNASIYFVGLGANPDLVAAHPGAGKEMKPGDEMWFDVKYTDKGGHPAGLNFTDDLKKKDHDWFVSLDYNSTGSFAQCTSNYYTCTPSKATKTNHISLMTK